MGFEVRTTDVFERQAKKLLKKYVSLKTELAILIDQLEQNPTQGTLLADNCYKIRLAISSKRKGKSGGARVITQVLVAKERVYLLTIYDKSDTASVSAKELKELLKILK